MRGTFANIRIKNEMVPGVEGGMTKHLPDGKVMPIYDAAMQYQKDGVPLVIVAGKEYGTGSSRDWAAKGTRLLGVKAVIVESFERIHRSNLVGMGVLPLQFKDGMTRQTPEARRHREHSTSSASPPASSRAWTSPAASTAPTARPRTITLLCRIDTLDEVEYFRHGGILQYVLRNMMKAAS